MSQLLYQYFLKKTNLDHVVNMGPEEDPYFEEIPEDELHFYQRKGAKRKRRLPNFIPEHDMKILNSVKRKAYRLDLQLSLCGLRIGWAGIIGLIPWIGDCIALALALQVLKKAQEIDGGLPAVVRSRMMANIAFDFGIGLIPIVGDFINVLYKCNSRNFILLEGHLTKKYNKAQGGTTEPTKKHTIIPKRGDKTQYKEDKSVPPPKAVKGSQHHGADGAQITGEYSVKRGQETSDFV